MPVRRAGYFQFLRSHEDAPARESVVVGWGGQRYAGLNFASQDYLGLSRHPSVASAAADACLRFGTHSAGSEPMGGGLAMGKQLEVELGSYLGKDNIVLFPTGWAAGYGVIKALVRPYDHVVIDVLAHDCLQQGARASTPNVRPFVHNDLDSLRKRLRRIRRSNADGAVLVVTESLFSMDSDHTEFPEFFGICREFEAATLVDVAHDLGVLGSRWPRRSCRVWCVERRGLPPRILLENVRKRWRVLRREFARDLVLRARVLGLLHVLELSDSAANRNRAGRSFHRAVSGS